MSRFLLGAVQLVLLVISVAAINNRPIIGIYTQPSKTRAGYAYLVASYVKFVEMSGARAVPIHFDSPRARLLEIFNSVNGILFTGGGQTLKAGTTFFDNAQYLWNLALESNRKGDYFPLWGTCQGYQLFHILASGVYDEDLILSNYDSYYVSYPLYFDKHAVEQSKMLGNSSGITADMLQDLATQNITLNIHHQGIAPQTYEKYPKMKALLSVLASNKDQQDKPFSSVVEARNYPFYGTQFHPEWPMFEWYDHPSVVHTESSLRANGFFSKFFVNEARKNNHKFPSVKEEAAALIYNYAPEFTESQSKDEQTYFFKYQ
jgi:gamma-glutamyl hydrolase